MPFITQDKTNWKFFLIVVVLAIIIGGGILTYQYWWMPKEEAKNTPKPIACTQEAKLCPDGSYVSRTDPNCEFATCPATSTEETANWNIYSEGGISLKYLQNFEHLTFAPAVTSLENYLQLYTDKLEKEIINKKMNSFGEVKEGISYTAHLMPSDCLEIGFIFNHGQFTYHFWDDDCHADASLILFLKSLATIKFIDNLPKISVKEMGDVRFYKDENYGIEFEYPKEWGSLAFLSIEKDAMDNKIYLFAASGELISTLYYHQGSKIIAFIENGEKYEKAYGGKPYQEILKVILPKKEIKTIYTMPEERVKWSGEIQKVNLSPDGKYIYFSIFIYESYDCMMVNIDSGLNITNCNIILYDPYKDVYWSLNNKLLAIRSEHSDFGGEGVDGLFVSDYDNPEQLNEVFSFTWKEHISGSNIYDIHFIGDHELFFAVLLEECGYEEEWTCITTYKYNAKTEELKEIID